MIHEQRTSFRRKLLPMMLGGALIFGAVMGGALPTSAKSGGGGDWATNYEDALIPCTQLALGTMHILQEDESRLANKEAVATAWQALLSTMKEGASQDRVKAARKKVEAALGADVVGSIQARRYSVTDLMAFMMSAGMKPPAGGTDGVNMDAIAAQHVIDMLSGKRTERFEIVSVSPDRALSPLEHLTLGTALLLERDRDSFDMSQVFRMALYFRPLRRLHDPNPLLRKAEDGQVETVYLDRIMRVLKPEQIRQIREWSLTKDDLNEYLRNHPELPGLDLATAPREFALLEYVVNDFHEQIEPAEKISPEDKEDWFIPESVLALDGNGPDHGKRIFEAACAACHGADGQGRFPPISMRSYLELHSDHEHHAIVSAGPPQRPGAQIVMPTFSKYLTDRQIAAVTAYIRTWEEAWDTGKMTRRGEQEAKASGVTFYDTPQVLEKWQNGTFILDVQDEIAYRIMGHIPGSTHILPWNVNGRLDELPRDQEIIVVDMFGSQGLPTARLLAEQGFKVGYLSPGMMDWHVVRNLPTKHN
jgi:rhodanese-related sulfurtransferase/cytochrome c553